MFKKIDFITEAEDVDRFIKMGVNIFGFPFNPDDFYYITEFIRNSTAQFSLIIEEEEHLQEIDDDILNLFDYLQFSTVYMSSNSVLRKPSYLKLLSQAPHLGIIISRYSIDHDDPSLNLWEYREALSEGNPFSQRISWYQVEILPDVGGGDSKRGCKWDFLKRRGVRLNPDDYWPCIADLQETTEALPISISLDFTNENIQEILQTFPQAHGIHFNLREDDDELGYHNWSSFAEIEAALSGLV